MIRWLIFASAIWLPAPAAKVPFCSAAKGFVAGRAMIFTVSRLLYSYAPKKWVLFCTIGPPIDPPYRCWSNGGFSVANAFVAFNARSRPK